MSEGSGQLLAATSGWQPTLEERLTVEFAAYGDGGVAVRVDSFRGVRFSETVIIFEGNGAIGSGHAIRAFNEAVETFSQRGFTGMTPIPEQYALEIAEAAAYVVQTGAQPLLDEKFRIKPGDDDAGLAAAATVRAELRGDDFKGFDGFLSFAELRNGGPSDVPAENGVYLVMRRSKEEPAFLEESCGGHFKGKNPTELVDVLKAKWVPGTPVVYIGKGDSLRDRLRDYAAFGAGRRVGHWGGRYIWQLADRDELVVAWKPCQPDQTAAAFEAQLVRAFKAANGGRLPFANIDDPSRG